MKRHGGISLLLFVSRLILCYSQESSAPSPLLDVAAPTIAPSQALFTSQPTNDPFDWNIVLLSSTADAKISRDTVTQVLSSSYAIPMLYGEKGCRAELYLYDCITRANDTSVYISLVDTSSARSMKVDFGLEFASIRESLFYKDLGRSNKAMIKYCTRIDCYLGEESVSFHETKTQITIDLLAGFATEAALYNQYQTFKTLRSYALSLFVTDGFLSPDSLTQIETSAEMFLDLHLNQAFPSNPVVTTIEALGQEAISREVRRRVLRSVGERMLATQTGSKIELSISAQFTFDPAPNDDDVFDATENIWTTKKDGFLDVLNSIIDFCDSELATISDVELEYQKNLTLITTYGNGTMTEELVNSTSQSNFLDLSLEEIEFIASVKDACGDLGGLDNITDVGGAVINPSQDVFSVIVKLGADVVAFFCDSSNRALPAPVLSPGDVVQFCVTTAPSQQFILEDIFSFTMNQEGVAPYYGIKDGSIVSASIRSCANGLCNIIAQVPSRFYQQNSVGALDISGVAILDFVNGRRRLDEGADNEAAYFQLQARIRADEDIYQKRSSSLPVIIILIAFAVFVPIQVCIYLCFCASSNYDKDEKAGSHTDDSYSHESI